MRISRSTIALVAGGPRPPAPWWHCAVVALGRGGTGPWWHWAVVALGGLQDCTIQFPHVPEDELRAAAVDAACAALGLAPAG